MVKLDPVQGKALKGQNTDLLASLGAYKDSYSEEVLNQALTILQDPNFLSEGLLKVLLMSLQNGADISGGGSGLSSGVQKAIDKLKDELQKEQTNTIKQLEGLENSVKTTGSELTKTSQRIYQRLFENEFNGPMATILSTMQLTIAEIRKRYADDLIWLQEALADSQLSYEEKIRFSYLLNVIKEEYPSILKELQKYEVDSTRLQGAYTRLFELVGTLLLEKNTTTVVDSNLVTTYFADYYDELLEALTSMLSSATSKFNKLVDEAAKKVNQITDINGYLLDATVRKVDFSTFLKEILADKVMNPAEKEKFSSRYYIPIFETLYPRALELAKSFGKDYTELNRTADAVRREVETLRLLDQMDEPSQVLDYKNLLAAFLDFYQKEIDLYGAIANQAEQQLDTHKSDIVQHTTGVNQTNKELDLTAKEIKSVGSLLQTTQAGVTITADSIRDKVERISMTRDLSTSNEIINGAGLNLYVASNSNPGFIEPTTKALLPTVNGSRVSEKIPIQAGLAYTASLWNNSTDNTIWIYWLDTTGRVLQVDFESSREAEFSLTETAPPTAAFAQLVTYQTENSHLQFQVGSVATAYRMSSYDSINNVILAQTEVTDKQRDLDENLANFNDYSLFNYQATELLEKALFDGTLTQAEKDQLGDILQGLSGQYRYISGKMASYGDTASMEKLDSYILALADFTNLLDDTSGDFVVTSISNVKSDYKAFFDESKKLMETLSDYILADLKQAKERATASTKTALDAETLRNTIKRDMESTAHTVGTLQKFKVDEDAYATSTQDRIRPFLADNVLSALEKTYVNDVVGRIKVEDEWYQVTADKLGVGKAGFLTAKAGLLDILNPMLTLNELQSASRIDGADLGSKIEEYYREKSDLLEGIIKAYLAKYSLLQTQYSAAYNQYELKNEELLTYQTVVAEARSQISDLTDRLDEIKNAVQYTIRLTSSMGEIFTNGNVNTRLSVTFLKNGINYTDTLRPGDIIWGKVNEKGEVDEEWNTAHINAGPHIDITEADLTGKAIFSVKIYELVD